MRWDWHGAVLWAAGEVGGEEVEDVLHAHAAAVVEVGGAGIRAAGGVAAGPTSI